MLAAVVTRLEKRLNHLDPGGKTPPWGEPGPGELGGPCALCACGCRDTPGPKDLKRRDWGEGGPSTAAVARGGINPE